MSNHDALPDDFGKYLRQARESRSLSLREISVTTKISMTVLQALEANDTAQVPGGIFGRSFVRTYAEEVGLDPDTAVKAFLETLPTKGTRESVSESVRGAVGFDNSEGFGNEQIRALAFRLVLISLPIVALILFFATR